MFQHQNKIRLGQVNRVLLITLGVCLLTTKAAMAGGPLNPTPGPWSLAMEKRCAAGQIWACYLWLLDPPTNITQIGFEISYDSSLMTIYPEQSGFLNDFSADGSYTFTPAGTFVDGTDTAPGGPRAGTTYSFVVTDNTISLTYDLSANPVPVGGDQNFFAIAFEPIAPIVDVVFYDNPVRQGADLYQVSTFCQTDDPLGASCGSSNSIWGASLVFVPEPATAGFLTLGVLTAFGRRRRARS